MTILYETGRSSVTPDHTNQTVSFLKVFGLCIVKGQAGGVSSIVKKRGVVLNHSVLRINCALRVCPVCPVRKSTETCVVHQLRILPVDATTMEPLRVNVTGAVAVNSTIVPV